MLFLRVVTAAGVLASLLTSCQSTPAAKAESKPSTEVANGSTGTNSQNYLKVTFDGKTTVYPDASISDEGQLGSVKGWQISAGSSGDNYLTIYVYGTQAGIFPYRKDMKTYEQVSQVDYKVWGTQFSNYKVVVCPTESGYYSTDGQVKVTEYVPGKLARGTFSGVLLDQNAEDQCSKVGKPFSGEFSLVKK